LDALLDEVGKDESHLLISLIDIAGVLIEGCEGEYLPKLNE
jgi:hypothetical protein